MARLHLPLTLAILSFGCTNARHQPKTSVLLISIDTLRADRLGAYGDTHARTPVLDAFARQGVVFERAYTPVPLTLPAHASLMTGLLPPEHGVRGNGAFALAARVPTLAEAFKNAGRSTGAFVGAFPLARRFGLARGFDEYDDAVTKAAGLGYDFAERPATDVVLSATKWLAAHPEPVFAWVHVFDPHAPYNPPSAFRSEDPYRDEIAAVDSALGSLLTTWASRTGPAVAAVVSDHGEAFGEHGEWSHGLFVYDTTLHVPLMMRGQGFPAGTRNSTTVSLVDVAATLLEAAGVSGSPIPGASLSHTLSAKSADRSLYAETLSPRLDFGWSELRSWRSDGYKWIRAPKPELYALREDPAEAHNRAAVDATRSAALDAALTDSLSRTGELNARRQPDPETAEKLRSLGYVQGPGSLQQGADPKDKVEIARRIALSNGPFTDWAAAIRTHRPLLAMDPANPLLNMRLADALLRSGQAQASLPYFARVIVTDPMTVDPYVGYGTALAQTGRLKDARAQLERGLRVDSSNGQLHYNLGEIARIEGRAADAKREYEAARLDPVTSTRAQARLGELR